MDSNTKLTVQIRSFSYKRGIPYDESGHGGGYVFDCRSILNPGKFERYMMLSGKDREVVDFFLKNTRMEAFIDLAYRMVRMTMETYMERGFTHLMVAFGCTGGQHRSVYCAERLAERIKQDYKVGVDLAHLDLKN